MIEAKFARGIYYRLVKIRLVEEAIAKEYANQEMRCPVHLSIGQEAVAVGVLSNFNDQDVIFSTHRCHSHYLGKGGDLNAMIAELYGKQNGCANGLGGSMHLFDKKVSMLGASAIVGGSIPLAVGAALSFKLSNAPYIAAPFFGDGATEEGVFHECLNFAALKNLPVIFVCENNFASISSTLEARRPLDNIFKHGELYGIPGYSVDGNDVIKVHEVAKRAVQQAKRNGGPSLIEARTYRMMEHCGPKEDKSSGIRTPEVWQNWKTNCPIRRFEKYCQEHKLLDLKEQESIKTGVFEEIKAAFEFAKSGEEAVNTE